MTDSELLALGRYHALMKQARTLLVKRDRAIEQLIAHLAATQANYIFEFRTLDHVFLGDSFKAISELNEELVSTLETTNQLAESVNEPKASWQQLVIQAAAPIEQTSNAPQAAVAVARHDPAIAGSN